MKATDMQPSTLEPFDFEDVTLTEMLPASVRAELKSIDLKQVQRKGLALKRFERNFEAEVDTHLDFEDFALTEMLTRDFPERETSDQPERETSNRRAHAPLSQMLLSGAMDVNSMELSLAEPDEPPALPLTLRLKSTPPPAPTSDDDAWLATLPEATRLELEAVRNASTRWPLAPRLNHAIAKPVGRS